MIQLIKPYFRHTDDRGSITGIINAGEWRELNIIISDAGVERGNHYHKKVRELFIILEGEIIVRLQSVHENSLIGTESVTTVTSGDVFIIEPLVNHIFIPKTSAKWINALSAPMDPLQPDINRITSHH